MSQTKPAQILFRGVGGRNLDDQGDAIAEGYNSVLEYAVDQLAKRLILLEQRVDQLEGTKTSHIAEGYVKGLHDGDPED